MTEARALLEVARAAAEAGAQVAVDWQRRELKVEEKAASDDLVSQADREAEAAIRAVLREARPDDAVLGEEDGQAAGTSAVRWVVDPIDGTTNYLYGRADWAVSVAAMDEQGCVLAGVVVEPAIDRVTHAALGHGTWSGEEQVRTLTHDDLERALVELNFGRPEQKADIPLAIAALVPHVRDLRRGGSAAAALAQVATSRADAAWLPGLQPWDIAAGVLLVSEAGGVTGDLVAPHIGRVPTSGDVLAASPVLWRSLRALLAPVYRL